MGTNAQCSSSVATHHREDGALPQLMCYSLCMFTTAIVTTCLGDDITAVSVVMQSDGVTALMIAAESGHVNVVKILIERKADVNKLTEVIMYILFILVVATYMCICS